jgi:hypothetical protein
VKQKLGLSIETLQALQLATDFKLGALSPQLRWFDWGFLKNLKGHPAGTLDSYVSLFIGEQVDKITLGDYRDDPIYLGSVMSTARRLPRLRELGFCGQVTSPIFTTQYITTFPWEFLEEVHLSHISREIVVHLASLPRLRQIWVFESVGTSPPLQETVPAKPAGQNDFVSLRALDVMCWDFDMIKPLLQAVSPSNKVERVSTSCPTPAGLSECQGAISAIRDYCNPHTLREVDVEDTLSHGWQPEVELDMYPDPSEEDVDISGLAKFVNLHTLVVRWQKSIQLTPYEIALIPTWWPNIRHLDLCRLYPSQGRIPAINHTHVLDIARGLPKLRFLGIRFDTTQIPGQHRGPIETFRLEILRAGESPIVSPSRVAGFIKRHFPYLEKLDFDYETVVVKETTILDKRWAAVAEALG